MIVPINLRQTDEGIYYIHDYIPTRASNYSSEEDVIISREILDYKNFRIDAFEKYTNELMRAIAQISFHISGNKIGLVAVPPSKIEKASPIRNSIWTIKQWYDMGIARQIFGCNKDIYDYGALLTRVLDVPTSHKSKIRATYEQQIESIKCSRNRLWRYRTTFIILDDITTKGTSINACRDILIQNGVETDNIYRLAIARTKWVKGYV